MLVAGLDADAAQLERAERAPAAAQRDEHVGRAAASTSEMTAARVPRIDRDTGTARRRWRRGAARRVRPRRTRRRDRATRARRSCSQTDTRSAANSRRARSQKISRLAPRCERRRDRVDRLAAELAKVVLQARASRCSLRPLERKRRAGRRPLRRPRRAAVARAPGRCAAPRAAARAARRGEHGSDERRPGEPQPGRRAPASPVTTVRRPLVQAAFGRALPRGVDAARAPGPRWSRPAAEIGVQRAGSGGFRAKQHARRPPAPGGVLDAALGDESADPVARRHGPARRRSASRRSRRRL